jgi:hypothetical protein
MEGEGRDGGIDDVNIVENRDEGQESLHRALVRTTIAVQCRAMRYSKAAVPVPLLYFSRGRGGWTGG